MIANYWIKSRCWNNSRGVVKCRPAVHLKTSVENAIQPNVYFQLNPDPFRCGTHITRWVKPSSSGITCHVMVRDLHLIQYSKVLDGIGDVRKFASMLTIFMKVNTFKYLRLIWLHEVVFFTSLLFFLDYMHASWAKQVKTIFVSTPNHSNFLANWSSLIDSLARLLFNLCHLSVCTSI